MHHVAKDNNQNSPLYKLTRCIFYGQLYDTSYPCSTGRTIDLGRRITYHLSRPPTRPRQQVKVTNMVYFPAQIEFLKGIP